MEKCGSRKTDKSQELITDSYATQADQQPVKIESKGQNQNNQAKQKVQDATISTWQTKSPSRDGLEA